MKTPLSILIFCVVAVASEVSEGDDKSTALPDLALQAPRVTAEFDPDTVKSSRGAQGVPAIERTAAGRLWAAWYAGPSPRGVESSRSYVVLATSSDDKWVRIIAEAKAKKLDLNFPSPGGGETILMQAVARRYVNAVKRLLELKVDTNFQVHSLVSMCTARA